MFKLKIGYLGDLWSFNITSNLWTWLSGTDRLDMVNLTDTYGTFRVSSPKNEPESRKSHSMIFDRTHNLLIVHGGESKFGKFIIIP